MVGPIRFCREDCGASGEADGLLGHIGLELSEFLAQGTLFGSIILYYLRILVPKASMVLVFEARSPSVE